MSVKFTLFKKKSPKTQSMQWYAAPKSSYPTADATTPSESSRGAAISDIETEATLRQVGQYIPHELIKGNTVKVPGLGTFQLSFHSKGVDDIALFDAEKMISGIHVVFLPEKALKNTLATQLNLVNAGVKEGNVTYPSVTDYLRAMNKTAAESTQSGSDRNNSDSIK